MYRMNEHQSSQEWLRVHGLEAAGLSLPQILCSLGFQQRSGDVQALGRPVSSQYCTRLFLQHPDQAGHVYNLVEADEARLQELEARLLGAVDCLKQRLHWLNSGSRKQCGVVAERKVVLAVLGGCSTKGRKARPSLAVRAASRLLQEQGSHLTHLNIVSGASQWREQLAEVTGEVITEASQWLQDTTPTPAQETTPTLIAALGSEQVEAAYVIVEGNQSAEELEELAGEVQCCSVPAHVVVLDCTSSALLEQCQHLATACGGRCHADGGKEGSLCLPRPDVMAVWRELEQARDTLAQVQALRLEVAERTRAYHDRTHADHGSSQCTPLHEKRRVHSDVSKPAPAVRKTPPSQGSREKTARGPAKAASHSPALSSTCNNGRMGKKAGKRAMSKPGASPERTIASPMGSQQSGYHSEHGGQRSGRQGASIGRRGNVVRGYTVLASCKHDGFYYKGSVVHSVAGGSVRVRFVDRTEETTPLTQLFVVGGAGPRPLLRCGDHVLCCVRQSRGWHCSQYGVCDFYVPARVQVVPDNLRRGHALFTVTTLSGEQVSCHRSGLEKISKSRYLAACSQIRYHHQQTSRHTQTEEVATQPSQQHTTPDKEDSHSTSDREDSHSMSGNTEREHQVGSHVAADPEQPEGEESLRATTTDLLGTEERGTSVCISTQEQAVGTGPLMVDHSTVTLPTTADKQVGTSQEETDFPESPEVGLAGCRVLCRWPDDSWYYRASVMGRGKAADSWILRAESGEVADIPASDIITDCQPQPIVVGSAVLGPHPLFPDSYAPGKVVSISGSSCTVQFYDSMQKLCLCDEVHPVPPGLYEEAVSRLEEREGSWVGQAVVARRDSDGVYCPAVVSERLDRQCFELQWADGGHQEQSILHMFGPLTTRRALHAGDHVLALAMPGLGVCLPGTLTGRQEEEGALEVKFSDGERQAVSLEQCFWISPAYFMSVVEYISTAFSSQNQLL